MKTTTTTTSDVRSVLLKLAPNLFERVETHVERMRAAAPGVTLTRLDAIRSLLIAALDRAEAQERGAKPPA